VIPVGLGRVQVVSDISESVYREAYQEFRAWYDKL